MILAEITGIESASMICCMVFGAIGTLVGIVSLFRKQDVAVEQPLSVELVEQFVTKEDFKDEVSRLNKDVVQVREILRTEIPEMERRIMAADEIRSVKTHERINLVQGEIQHLSGLVEQLLKRK